jgi:2-dehydro-3-deoxygluconokinase
VSQPVGCPAIFTRVAEFATAAACLKHSITGDFNLVSLEEVERLVESGDAGPVRR